jgi:CheY-like chemotaxis protein
MVVDDEADVMEIMRKFLRKLGYSVFGFTHPFITPEQFEREPKSMSLLFPI